MSVCQRPGSKFWQFEFVMDGKRVQRSTKTTNKRDAEDIPRAFRTDVARGLVGIAKPKKERRVVSELLDKKKADLQRRGKFSNRNRNLFSKVAEYFGALTVEQITLEKLNGFIDGRQAEGRSNSTINHSITALRSAFKLAKLPFPEIKKLSEKHAVREGFFTRPELDRLLTHLPSDLRDFVLFAFLVGWRKGAISTLDWNAIEGDCIRLRAKHSKNGKPYHLRAQGELLELLQRRRAARAVEVDGATTLCNLVFHRQGRPVGEFYGSWRTAVKLAGMPDRLFHDLRRSAARRLIRSGNPQSVAMKITGHETSAMFLRYDITDDDTDIDTDIERSLAYDEVERRKVVALP